MVKMPRTFQNHQSNVGCSKFFNLKPNAGNKNKIQYQHAKIEKIFWFQSYSIANTQRARSFKKKQNKKGYGKCIAEYSFFKMRNLPSAL